jgi:hypothetical protein
MIPPALKGICPNACYATTLRDGPHIPPRQSTRKGGGRVGCIVVAWSFWQPLENGRNPWLSVPPRATEKVAKKRPFRELTY